MRVNSTGETRHQHRKKGGAGFHQRPPLYSYQLPLLFPFRVTELLLLRCLHWSVTLREELGALECSPLAATHHSAVSPHQRRANKRKEPLAQQGTNLSHTFLLRERSSQSALGPSPPRNSMLSRLLNGVNSAQERTCCGSQRCESPGILVIEDGRTESVCELPEGT